MWTRLNKTIENIPDYNGIGVYKIVHTKSQKVYIGSSIHCKTRLKEHNRSLPNNEMEKDALQGCFSAEILQEFPNGCTNRELMEAEIFHLEEAKKADKKVYNSSFHRPIHNQVRGNIDDFIFSFQVPKGKKTVIQDIAEQQGKSVNGYIKEAVTDKIKADTGQDIDL